MFNLTCISLNKIHSTGNIESNKYVKEGTIDGKGWRERKKKKKEKMILATKEHEIGGTVA